MGEPSEQYADTADGLVVHRQKKRQEMPPINKWTNASKLQASQQYHPLQSVSTAVGIVYELPKKWGRSLSTPAFDASPLHRRSIQIMTWGSATHEKDSVPSQLQVKALIGALWCRPLRQLWFKPRHYRSRPQHNLHGVRTAYVVYVHACFSHRNSFPRDLLMRSTSRRFAT